MTDSYSIVRQAIIEKQQVVATYNGYRREMCPHTLGTKKGKRQALFFQFGGESSSELPPDGEWRCIPVDKLVDISVQDGEWRTGDSHLQPQTCVDEIDVEVDY